MLYLKNSFSSHKVLLFFAPKWGLFTFWKRLSNRKKDRGALLQKTTQFMPLIRSTFWFSVYSTLYFGHRSHTLLFQSYWTNPPAVYTVKESRHISWKSIDCDECCILITILQCRHRSQERGRKSTFQIHSQKLYFLLTAWVYLISFKGRRRKSLSWSIWTLFPFLRTEEFQTCNKCVVWWW